jgi:hypothetical protein
LNFDQIDRLLNEWQQKAAMVSQNLLEHDMSAYQRLSDIQVRQQMLNIGDLGNSVGISGDRTIGITSFGDFGGGGQVFIWIFLVFFGDFG